MTEANLTDSETTGIIAPVELARQARAAALAKKGIDVVILDVRGYSPITDFYVIAAGTSPPHLKAMMNAVLRSLKTGGVTCYRRSGVPDDGWVVLDYYDFVIHILLKEMRDYYAIEELWADAPRLE